MKRIRPNKPPKARDELIAELGKDIQLLMLASALVHQHQTGNIPFPPHQPITAFAEIADLIKEKRNLKQRPSPVKVARHIAKRLMLDVVSGDCKGLTMPTNALFGWLVFLPGGNITKLPCNGEIPIETPSGEKFKLHIDINEDGKGSFYRYHDPESDSVRIGREHYLLIDPCDIDLPKEITANADTART